MTWTAFAILAMFSDKIREIEFDRIANSHLILKKDRFISRPMTEPSFNFN